MNIFKNSLISLLIVFAAVQSSFAQVTIGDLSVNSEPQFSTVKTKYGDFTVKQGTKPEYYDSGNVKSFYLENETQNIQTETLGSINIKAVAPVTEGIKIPGTIPLTFHENGTLKSFKLADKNPDGTYNLKIKMKKYNDEVIEARQGTEIEFYEDGSLKSFYVTADQSLSFLKTIQPETSEKRKFKNATILEFYEDGSLKTFTPSTATAFINPLNCKLQQKDITLAKNSNRVIGFYPANGSTLSLGSNINVSLVNGKPVYFYDNGSTLKQISWKYNTGFTISGVSFLVSQNQSFMNTVYFNEKNKIIAVKGIETEDYSTWGSGGETIIPFYTSLEGKTPLVKEIYFDDEGNPLSVVFDRNQNNVFIFSSKEIKENSKKGKETIIFVKLYYKNGKKNAAAGIKLRNFGTSFADSAYNSQENYLFVFDGENISKSFKLNDRAVLDETTEIFFNKNGEPLSCKYSDIDKKTVTEEIK